MTKKLSAALAAAVLAALPAATLAQSPSPAESTAPAASPSPGGMTAPMPPRGATDQPPSPVASPIPVKSNAPATSGPSAAKSNNGKHLGQIKKLQSGSLNLTDLRYALTHPAQEVGKVRSMKNISFDKLRIYKLPTNLKSLLKVGDANSDIPLLAELSPSIEVAQTNGSNSPIADLQYVLANINVSNALNNVSVLNNSNVNVGVTLADVLNGNKISIGQVAGIFVNGLGVITTITK